MLLAAAAGWAAAAWLTRCARALLLPCRAVHAWRLCSTYLPEPTSGKHTTAPQVPRAEPAPAPPAPALLTPWPATARSHVMATLHDAAASVELMPLEVPEQKPYSERLARQLQEQELGPQQAGSAGASVLCLLGSGPGQRGLRPGVLRSVPPCTESPRMEALTTEVGAAGLWSHVFDCYYRASSGVQSYACVPVMTDAVAC